MYIEEKIDLLKKSISPQDLVIRWNDYGQIMQTLESTFLRKGDHPYTEWAGRLAHVAAEPLTEPPLQWLRQRLIPKQKYWWIMSEETTPYARHRLFDATLTGGEALARLFHESPLYVGDKKYAWLLMIDREHGLIRHILRKQQM